MASTNQLTIPFRRSTQISLATALRQYVTDKYGQHPDTFSDDLATIDALRRDAVNVREAHASGIRKLQAYAAQLTYISGKFPVAINAAFTWYPALGYNVERPVVQNTLAFERANVLYNLAALYGQLGAAGSSSGGGGGGGVDALKTAASFFMQAAGVLRHLRETVVDDAEVAGALPEDMDAATLESLEQLQLAQAQECFWLRAVTERYKDATIAKLAACVADLYGAAGDAAVRSDAVSRAWIHHVGAKHHHFAAAAQYRASRDCLEKRRYGEEIARLQDALQCVAEGLREGRAGDLAPAVLDDLAGLKRRIEEDLKRAERDNDVIYLDVVPPKAELKMLDRAVMATARVPPQVATPLDYLADAAPAATSLGRALFAQLVPFAVHLAVSVYDERRDRLVHQNILHDLEVLTEQLHAALLDLNLPGALQAIERPLGLPGTLVQHAEELRYADAVGRARRGLADVAKLRAADRATFAEGRALLEAEADEDAQLRRKYGAARWTRPAGPDDEGGRGASGRTDSAATAATAASAASGGSATSAASAGSAGTADTAGSAGSAGSAASTAAGGGGNGAATTTATATATASGTGETTRPTSGRRLWANAHEIEGYFASSEASDGVVRDMFAAVEPRLALLAGPERALLDFVPNSRQMAPLPDAVKPALGRLRSAYNDVLRLEARRRTRADALRDKARADDVKPDIMRETARLERAHPHAPIVAAHFDDFFAARLRTLYDADAEQLVDRERDEQARLLDDVARASRALAAQQKLAAAAAAAAAHADRAREDALQQLDHAHYQYKEVVRNIEVARKFYNDLSRIVAAFRDQCRTWVQQRRRDAHILEDELSMPVLSSMSSLSLGPQRHGMVPPPPAPLPQQTAYAPSPHQPSVAALAPVPAPVLVPEPVQASAVQAWAGSGLPAQQQHMWTPDMGIRFSSAATLGTAPAAPAAPHPGGAGGGTTAAGSGGTSTTWNPSSGIRFG